MKNVLQFCFGNVTADISMFIGVVLLSLTLYFGVNPVEASVVDPLIRGTWFHMLLLVMTMPALIVWIFIGDSTVGLVVVFFVQLCTYMALGRFLDFLFGLLKKQIGKSGT